MSFALLMVALGALVTARLTRLISADRVALPLRAAIVRRYGPSSALGYLVHCRWCVSLWIAPPVAAGVLWVADPIRPSWWLPTVLVGAFLALAYSHLTALLAGFEDED